jgi:hypothetical protein
MKSESNDNRRWIIEGVFDDDDETKEKKVFYYFFNGIFCLKMTVKLILYSNDVYLEFGDCIEA